MILPSLLVSSQGWGLIDLLLRATFSPAQLPSAPRHALVPVEGLPIFPTLPLWGAVRLSFTARIEGAHSDCAASASKKDGLAAPPTLLRPRVARAQKIIRLHPLPFIV